MNYKELAVAQWGNNAGAGIHPQWEYLKEFGTVTPDQCVNDNCDYYKEITMPQPLNVVASTSATAQGWFANGWPLAMGILGFAVAGIAIVAVVKGVKLVVNKIFKR